MKSYNEMKELYDFLRRRFVSFVFIIEVYDFVLDEFVYIVLIKYLFFLRYYYNCIFLFFYENFIILYYYEKVLVGIKLFIVIKI